MSHIEKFQTLIQEITDFIGDKPLDQALQTQLNERFPCKGEVYARIFDTCRTAISEGWMCQYEGGGVRWSASSAWSFGEPLDRDAGALGDGHEPAGDDAHGLAGDGDRGGIGVAVLVGDPVGGGGLSGEGLARGEGVRARGRVDLPGAGARGVGEHARGLRTRAERGRHDSARSHRSPPAAAALSAAVRAAASIASNS